MRVKFFADIRECTGCKETEVPYEENIYRLLDALSNQYGKKLRQKLFSEDGRQLNNELIIMVNGRHISHLGGMEAPLKPDDLVQIFPVVAGG